MSTLRTYRNRQDKYGYFTLGFYHYSKLLDLYSTNIKEFEMFKDCFSLDSTYISLSQKYNMLHYFDLKEKVVEIKFLDKESGKEVISDTYSLNPTSYMIVRETCNFEADLKTTTVVNPAYGHVSMYSADKLSTNKPLIQIFRNKTDFLTNWNCVYTVTDYTRMGKHFQIESDISSTLLKYNNQSHPVVKASNLKSTNDVVDVQDFKSNKNTMTSGVTAIKNSTSTSSNDDVM